MIGLLKAAGNCMTVNKISVLAAFVKKKLTDFVSVFLEEHFTVKF